MRRDLLLIIWSAWLRHHVVASASASRSRHSTREKKRLTRHSSHSASAPLTTPWAAQSSSKSSQTLRNVKRTQRIHWFVFFTSTLFYINFEITNGLEGFWRRPLEKICKLTFVVVDKFAMSYLWSLKWRPAFSFRSSERYLVGGRRTAPLLGVGSGYALPAADAEVAEAGAQFQLFADASLQLRRSGAQRLDATAAVVGDAPQESVHREDGRLAARLRLAEADLTDRQPIARPKVHALAHRVAWNRHDRTMCKLILDGGPHYGLVPLSYETLFAPSQRSTSIWYSSLLFSCMANNQYKN